jgi:hypothetical protein
MLELWTATVISMPTTMAARPPPRPRSAFIERSTRAATRSFMFLVMKVSARKITASPSPTITLPSTPLAA